MHLKTLSLATIGLLFLTSGKFAQAEPIDLDVSIIDGKVTDVDASYLELFNDDDDVPENDFDLDDTEEVSDSLIKRDSCAKYHKVSGSDSCVKIAKKYGISLDNMYSWNPQIKKGCPNLNNGKKYCVKMSGSSSDSSSGSSSSGCAKTHKATNSDTCSKLAKSNGISLSQFYSLNPQVNKSCSNLNTGKTYCVKGGSGSKVTSLAAKKSTKKKTKKSAKKSSSSKETRKKLQTNAAFTYYWIAQENNYSGGKKVSVKTCNGKTIASVTEKYADALVMEGTGIVGSKIVNLGGCSCNNYKCFELVDRKTDPYGLTSYGSPLRPYVTIASNDLPKNTKIYVPSLVGWSVPGSSKKHNGCLLVDDQSWSFGGKHIDFYVYSMNNYEKLDKAHSTTKVDIYQGGSCKLQNYMS